MKTIPLDFSRADWTAFVWGHEMSGHPDDAAHQLAFMLPGETTSVTIAEIPLAITVDDMEPDGAGGSRPFASVSIDAEATARAIRFLAHAANCHAELLAALEGVLKVPEVRKALANWGTDELLAARAAIAKAK